MIDALTRREKEKKSSLDALAKIAYSVHGGAPAPAPKPEARKSTLPAAPKPKPRPVPAPPKLETDADRERKRKAEERRAKLEEERALRARRANELHRGAKLDWRGMDTLGVPSSIRRTAFDRDEPSVSQKITDVLGDARIKEGREKARQKGKRQGGR